MRINSERPISLFTFCQRWLELIAIVHILGGLALSFDWPSWIWIDYRNELFLVFNINQTVSVEANSIVLMLTQLFGPTVASWGILMFYLVRQLTRKGQIASVQISSADILILATLLWFVLDSAISLKFGMMLHITINAVAVSSILLPLIYLRLKL